MTKRRRARLDLARLLAILVVVAAIVYFNLNLFAPRLIPHSLRIGMIRRPLTLLLLGTDITFDAVTRKPLPGLKGRTDTIMLVRIDPLHSHVSLLSIPRDTLVRIPGYGPAKINAAYVYGGHQLTSRMVTELTGVPIDHYIELRPTAVTRIVDLLGGVVLEVEFDMRYVDRAQGLDINLKKGWQKLSGGQAHDYIRFRHDIYGDIGRVGRQQNFLKALTRSLIKPNNLVIGPYILFTALQEVESDIPLILFLRLLNYGRTIGLESVQSATIPGEATMTAEAGSVWLVDRQRMKKTVEQLFNY